jgi:cell division transport system ATP-binding protein
MIKEENKKEEKSKIMIKFDAVSKIYKGNFMALEEINLDIHEGEFISVVGQSGSGKSTLLKLIYAEEAATTGEVYFNGNPLSIARKKDLPSHRREIGTVFQDFKLLPKKTTYENIAYALEVSGAPDEEIAENVPQILDIVGLKDKANKYPHQLSGGEQQKAAIARALVHTPMIIVADEPTGNLDPIASLEIVKLLIRINELGTTVILASHDKDIVDKANKRVLVLEKGRIIADYPKGKYKIS